jgi:hypothetical protein
MNKSELKSGAAAKWLKSRLKWMAQAIYSARIDPIDTAR